MDNRDYLIKHGWVQDTMLWHDPLVEGNRQLFTSAVSIQLMRDAARLDTALAALEAAEPMLVLLVELCGGIFDSDAKREYTDRAKAALALVRQVRGEGK